MKALGLILIVLGVVALAYQGITYTTHNEVADIAGLKIDTTERHSVPLSPVIGGLALASGIILVIAGAGGRTHSAMRSTTKRNGGHPTL